MDSRTKEQRGPYGDYRDDYEQYRPDRQEKTNVSSKTDLKAELAKYLPLAKSHLLLIAHREDLSISADAKARLAELEALERELRQPVETTAPLSGFMSDERNGIVPDPDYRTRFKVGERILPDGSLYRYYPRATVTEITARGFKYRYDERINLGPRHGWYQEGESFTDHGWNLAADQSPCSPEEPFARQPADCKHERASLKCADCGVDFIGTLKQQEKPFAKPDPRGDTAIWVLAWLARQGGLGHDKHRVIDAVMEGRATMRADGTLHIEPKSPEKARAPIDLNLEPIGKCDKCGRKVWKEDVIGKRDEMTQPDGGQCGGAFVYL